MAGDPIKRAACASLASCSYLERSRAHALQSRSLSGGAVPLPAIALLPAYGRMADLLGGLALRGVVTLKLCVKCEAEA